MSLTEQDRKTIVRYRIGKSDATMKEYATVYAAGHYTLAMQRLYYASYYLASALLIDSNITAQTHSGVKTMLHKEFVLTGKLSAESGKIYSILLGKRHEGDYDDCYDFTQEDLDEILPATLQLHKELRALLD